MEVSESISRMGKWVMGYYKSDSPLECSDHVGQTWSDFETVPNDHGQSPNGGGRRVKPTERNKFCPVSRETEPRISHDGCA